MTLVLPEDENNVTRLKAHSHPAHAFTKSSGRGRGMQEESRSFLDFSRENLSISNSELEQGFMRPGRARCCCSRQTLISLAALLLALGCAALELWKLKRVLSNARDIEALRRDVETLKHRFLEKDLLEELKAFEEQLYGEAATSDEEPSSGNDYDSSYDESASASPLQGHSNATSGPSGASPAPCTSKDLEEALAALRRTEAERGQTLERSAREQGGRIAEHRAKRLAVHSAGGPRRRTPLEKLWAAMRK